MQFGVFSLVNLEKSRTRGSGAPKYTAAYEVTTRSGTKYLQYFYPKTEGRIPGFLLNVAKRGGVASRLTGQATVESHATVLPGMRLGGHGHEPTLEETRGPLPEVVTTSARAGVVRTVTVGSPLVISGGKPAPAPLPPSSGHAQPAKTEVTTLQVAEQQMQHENDVRYKYERLGDRAKEMDPTGYKQALVLRELDTQIQSLRDKALVLGGKVGRAVKNNTPRRNSLLEEKAQLEGALRSITQTRDKLLADFTQRPLSWKLARIAGVETEMAALKDEGKRWIAAHPVEWKRYLQKHKRRQRYLKTKVDPKKLKHWLQNVKGPLEYPPFIESKLNALKLKLKGIKGSTVAVQTKAAKLGVHQNLVVIPSKEVGGITPDDGVAAYLLTTGEWRNKAPNGTNQFTPGEAAQLFKEFSGVIQNIAVGRGFKPGWAKVFDLKDLAEDLQSHLKVQLFNHAALYSPERAKSQLEQGHSFPEYVIGKLDGEARNFVRTALKEAVRQKQIEPEALNEEALNWNENGDFTRDQLRDVATPMAVPYASPEDLIAVKDLQKLLTTKFSRMDSVAILSKLNLFNPTNVPKGGGGLKSWDEVAQDVVAHEKARGKDVGEAYVKNNVRRNLEMMFAPGAALGAGWVGHLTASEKVGLREGLRTLHDLVSKRSSSIPGMPSWRVTKEPTGNKRGVTSQFPTHSDVHRVVGGAIAEKMRNPVVLARRMPVLFISDGDAKKSLVVTKPSSVDEELAVLFLKTRRLLKAV